MNEQCTISEQFNMGFKRDGNVTANSKGIMSKRLRPVVLSGPSGCGKSTIIKKLMADHPNKFGFSVSRLILNIERKLHVKHCHDLLKGNVNKPEWIDSANSLLYEKISGEITRIFKTPDTSATSTERQSNAEELCSSGYTTRNPRPGEVDGKDYHYTNSEAMRAQIINGEFLENASFSGNMYGTSKKAVQDVLDSGRICIMDIDSQGVKSVKKAEMDCLLVFVKPPTLEELERRLRGRGTEKEEAIQKRLAASKVEFEFAAEPGAYNFIVVNDDLERAYQDLKSIIDKEIADLH